MSKAGDRLIASATEAAEFAKRDVDVQMLKSMELAFRSGMYRRFGFSFNDEDMADLMERSAAALVLSARASEEQNKPET